MTFLPKIFPWIQNGISGKIRRNAKCKTGSRWILKGAFTNGEDVTSGPRSALFHLKT